MEWWLLSSMASAVYDKAAALAQDKQTAWKLQRVGEAHLSNGQWSVNNEMVSAVSWAVLAD